MMIILIVIVLTFPGINENFWMAGTFVNAVDKARQGEIRNGTNETCGIWSGHSPA